MAAHAGMEHVPSQRSELHVVGSPARSKGQRLRRVMTREQGRALETIGHAVDYLNDCAVHLGPDHELVNLASPAGEAVHILVSARFQILQSLPLKETFSQRMWNAIFRRKSPPNASPVVRLSQR